MTEQITPKTLVAASHRKEKSDNPDEPTEQNEGKEIGDSSIRDLSCQQDMNDPRPLVDNERQFMG